MIIKIAWERPGNFINVVAHKKMGLLAIVSLPLPAFFPYSLTHIPSGMAIRKSDNVKKLEVLGKLLYRKNWKGTPSQITKRFKGKMGPYFKKAGL